MDDSETLVEQLIVGFETLQNEYQKLHSQQEALERKLQHAREQYNEVARLYGKDRSSTPPLSLPTSPKPQNAGPSLSISASDILSGRHQLDAACKVGQAVEAAKNLQQKTKTRRVGVGQENGMTAELMDKATSSVMPSISESPLEQDFTVQGVPSRLGCPFASMAGKKLSSHAASVMSRYRYQGSIGTGGGSGQGSGGLSSTSRINGRESIAAKQSRRRSTNIRDPIKAEICGLSDHSNDAAVAIESPRPVEEAGGVCPIRFLNQHSAEEVATYFEKHKHELPRSHEVCVRRYQANEEQIKQLDAKYGNLVSMIQGLGQKHQPMLPSEPAEAEDEADDLEDGRRNDIAGWARSVSAQVGHAMQETDHVDLNDNGSDTKKDLENSDEREPHFERPLRDIRVGESPSRPWGYNVPARYHQRRGSDTSSRPAMVSTPEAVSDKVAGGDGKVAIHQSPPTGELRCPFGFDSPAPQPAQEADQIIDSKETVPNKGIGSTHASTSHPTRAQRISTTAEPCSPIPNQPQIVIQGPVFIGYSADDAAKILQQAKFMPRT